MKQWKTYLFATVITLAPAWARAQAQQRIDIQLHRCDDGTLQALIVPSHNFDGLLSCLVFTLAWDSTLLATEPTIVQSEEQEQAIALAPSGPAFNVGPMKYRKYAGIGMTPLRDTQLRMQSGKSLALARVTTIGQEYVFISDGTWLKERRYNGAFYISLNGVDRTGKIITVSPLGSMPDVHDLVVAPNPYDGGPLTYIMNVANDGMAEVTLSDEQGRTVVEWKVVVNAGRNTGTLSLSTLASGAYVIRVRLEGKDLTAPLVALGR